MPLNGLLSGSTESFVDSVTRLQHNMKATKLWMGDLAGRVAMVLGHRLAPYDTMGRDCDTSKDTLLLEGHKPKFILSAVCETNGWSYYDARWIQLSCSGHFQGGRYIVAHIGYPGGGNG